jgi:hypothetical protein
LDLTRDGIFIKGHVEEEEEEEEEKCRINTAQVEHVVDRYLTI